MKTGDPRVARFFASIAATGTPVTTMQRETPEGMENIMDDNLKSIAEAANAMAAKLLGCGHEIVDPRPIRAENPLSFYLPCQPRLDAVAPGDAVKIILSPDFNRNVPGHNELTERLWIKVTAAEGDDLTGIVESNPMDPGMLGIDRGGEISFKRHHVIGIETTRADDPAETNDNDR